MAVHEANRIGPKSCLDSTLGCFKVGDRAAACRDPWAEGGHDREICPHMTTIPHRDRIDAVSDSR